MQFRLACSAQSRRAGLGAEVEVGLRLREPLRGVARGLRERAEALGYETCRTLIASGNLVFETKKTPEARLEAALEAMIEESFGLFSDVMVRNPAEWSAALSANPFPKKAKADPVHLVCMICKTRPDAAVIESYLEKFRAKHDRGEQLSIVGRDI